MVNFTLCVQLFKKCCLTEYWIVYSKTKMHCRSCAIDWSKVDIQVHVCQLHMARKSLCIYFSQIHFVMHYSVFTRQPFWNSCIWPVSTKKKIRCGVLWSIRFTSCKVWHIWPGPVIYYCFLDFHFIILKPNKTFIIVFCIKCTSYRMISTRR